jgi:hypothetical protein
VGQATHDQRRRRLASDRAAGEFPGACPVTQTTAGAPADAAPLAGPDGDAVPAADSHAAADGDAAADEPAHHRAADTGAHPVSVHVCDSLTA